MKENLAFIFPGQGSQIEGMLEADKNHPIVIKTLQEADEALGYSLSEIILNGSKESLDETIVTQPAILTVSIALWRLWEAQNGQKPAFVAGHSLGEYSALVAADVIDFKDAVKLVAKRAEFMQNAVAKGVGSMSAILGLDDEVVKQICLDAANGEIVSAVNFNAPGQVVIAGETAAVNRAAELLKEAGAKKVVPLSVSVPSHCLLMKPAADQMALMLENIEFKAPSINVIHNVDVQSHEDTVSIKKSLVEQLYCPVRWTETVQFLAEKGINQIVECGPNKVLTGLTKRIDKSITSFTINSLTQVEEVKNQIETV